MELLVELIALFVIVSIILWIIYIFLKPSSSRIDSFSPNENVPISNTIEIVHPEQIEHKSGDVNIKKEKREKLQQAKLAALKRESENILNFVKSKILVDRLVIDSNVWMNEEYEPIFEVLRYVLKGTNRSLFVLQEQFDEICNIKQSQKSTESSQRNARIALRRIESLQKNKSLQVESARIQANPKAYADPYIIKLLVSEVKCGKKICLLTDDRELRIRVREHLRDVSQAGQSRIVQIESILPRSIKFIEARKNGINFSV